MKFAKLIAQWFGLGRIGFAPGTWGTLGAIPLCLWAAVSLTLTMKLLLIIPLVALASWSAGVTSRALQQPDASSVVIDEVAGFWITTLGIGCGYVENSLASWVIAFLVFRAFDVFKPFPIRALDRWSKTQFQHPWRLGFGIVADDLLAGVYSAIVLWMWQIRS